jgi:type II secretory pathway pseudopilin PulG
MPTTRRAFTLLETLAATVIIIVLAVLGASAYQGATAKGRMIREVRAAKNLITAYHAHAADNDGRFLPGMDFTVSKTWYEPYSRNITMMHASNRYPFRLAPYFDWTLNGTILVNDLAKQVGKMAREGTPMHDYVVSAFPAFGINYYFVGGCVTGTPASPSLTYPSECVTRSSLADRSILAFASGGTTDGTIRIEGYNILTPPRLFSDNWSSTAWKKGADPGLYGNVDARHSGKAVCAFLDSSIKLLGIDELRDMRLWNRNAAENNAPGYTLSF